MEKFNKKKWYIVVVFSNMFFVVLFGVLCLYIRLKAASINFSADGLSGIVNIYDSINLAQTVYYLYFSTVLVSIGGIVYSIYQKQKLFKKIKIPTIVYVSGNVLFVLASYRLISFVSTVLNGMKMGSMESIMSLGKTDFKSLEFNTNISIILLIFIIFSNLYFAYLLLSSKNKLIVKSNTKIVKTKTINIIEKIRNKARNSSKKSKTLIASGGVIAIVLIGIFTYFTVFKTTPINLIDQISVEYTGVSGNASATVNTDKIKKTNDATVNEFISNYIKYEIKPDDSLKNNEKITVTIVPDLKKMKKFKLTIPKLTKEFKVSNLLEYPDNIDLIKNIDEFAGKAEKLVVDDYTSGYGDRKNIIVTKIDTIFKKTSKSENSYDSSVNTTYFIYKVNYDTKNFGDKYENETLYTYVSLRDLVIDSKGKATTESDLIKTYAEYNTLAELEKSLSS